MKRIGGADNFVLLLLFDNHIEIYFGLHTRFSGSSRIEQCPVVVPLFRKEILSLFKELRLSCPSSNSVCSSMRLRRTTEGEDATLDEFDLYLEWKPDETAKTFLKKFALKHDLSLREIGNLITITPQKT